MDYKTSYCVIFTIICILIVRTISSKDKIITGVIKKPVVIKCHGGTGKNQYINITANSFADLLYKLSENIKHYVNVIDDSNYKDFCVVIEKAENNLHHWVNKQNNPLFTISISKENNSIDEEKYYLRNNIITINELIRCSKSDTDDPVEDKKDHNTLKMSSIKIKKKLLNLTDSLYLINNVLSSKNICTSDVFDIIPIEKILLLMQNHISDSCFYINRVSHNKNIPYSKKYSNGLPLRRSSKYNGKCIDRINLCKSGDLNLRDNNLDASLIVAKKSINKRGFFPQFANVSINNRHNICY